MSRVVIVACHVCYVSHELRHVSCVVQRIMCVNVLRVVCHVCHMSQVLLVTCVVCHMSCVSRVVSCAS